MMYIALAAFLTFEDCQAFLAANNLEQTWDRQCEAVVTGLAPSWSPRPMPKPERGE